MYTVGKIKLTQQALAVFVIGSIVSLLNLYLFRKAGWQAASLGFLVTFAYACYTTYLTNCIVVGDCKELAWFLVALNVITALAFIKMRVLGSKA